jgi:hypothetical protein
MHPPAAKQSQFPDGQKETGAGRTAGATARAILRNKANCPKRCTEAVSARPAGPMGMESASVWRLHPGDLLIEQSDS